MTKKDEGIPKVYTPAEVAESLKVSRRTVYRWIDSERLPAAKVGKGWRITEETLRNLLRQTNRNRKE